jgi:hypothetical protein
MQAHEEKIPERRDMCQHKALSQPLVAGEFQSSDMAVSRLKPEKASTLNGFRVLAFSGFSLFLLSHFPRRRDSKILLLLRRRAVEFPFLSSSGVV